MANKVVITIAGGHIEKVYAAPGTDVEVWDWDPPDPKGARPDELDMPIILARHGLVEVYDDEP